MRFPRLSISSLCGLVALAAADCGSYRQNHLQGRSLFGFGNAPAFDTGVDPIANVVVIALAVIVARRARLSLWLAGFAIGGFAVIVAFLIWGWVWPDGVRYWLRPIHVVWRSWSSGPMPASYLYLADTVCFFTAQLLVALCSGLLASRTFGGGLRRIPRGEAAEAPRQAVP
jgi:hypothetical protein